MAIKQYKPTTPARRGMTTRSTDKLTKKRPEKSLLTPKKVHAGRNNQGRITVRHQGAGVKRMLRLVDFSLKPGTTAKVIAIEYDPNRSAHIALIETSEGKKHYVLAGTKTKVGQEISAGEEASVSTGNRLPLRNIPLGSTVYNVELIPGKGGQLARSAGTKARLAAKEGEMAQLRLPSGETRLIRLDCYATLGSVGNEQHQNIKWGSAGRKRRLGKRPSVRGKAMNPADHPMGGGEGQSSPGRLPRTPWGQLAIGKKTRRRKKTNKLIVRSRKQAKRNK
ncbi:MAG: 50S ribosomal protein L2 [Candidatus Saccharimonadales bacterium]